MHQTLVHPMSKNRFEALMECLRFSHQPPTIPTGMNSAKYRWKLVDDFVECFNEHRATYFFPSDQICVDESFSRWYVQGGNWINEGIPHFVSMDWKPEDGCKIWSACDGRSGVMITLKLVKGKKKLDEESTDEERFNQGTKVLLKLIEPWNESNRFVCADSYFSSVQTALACKARKMKYIGAVKTATREFLMSYLGQYILGNRGSRHGLLAKDCFGDPELLAFVWADRDH
jgi:Transposase IS4